MAGTEVVPLGEPSSLIQLAEALRDYAAAGIAAGTRRTYGSAWRDFDSWCASVGLQPLPAEAKTVALYLTARAPPRLAVSTLARHLAAINAAHRNAGFDEPRHADLDQVWAGIRRTHGRPPRKKRALVLEDLRRVVAKLPSTRAGIRDRALILVCFAGALRRSELAGLMLGGGTANAVFVAGGLEVHLDKSKGDQVGRGAVVAIPYGKRLCPVAALQAWLAEAKISTGPIFRAIDRHGRISGEAMTGRSVAEIVKLACDRAGLDPGPIGAHSLRSGFLTSAADRDVPIDLMKGHARHAKADTTLGYVQVVDRFKRNAVSKVGL